MDSLLPGSVPTPRQLFHFINKSCIPSAGKKLHCTTISQGKISKNNDTKKNTTFFKKCIGVWGSFTYKIQVDMNICVFSSCNTHTDMSLKYLKMCEQNLSLLLSKAMISGVPREWAER